MKSAKPINVTKTLKERAVSDALLFSIVTGVEFVDATFRHLLRWLCDREEYWVVEHWMADGGRVGSYFDHGGSRNTLFVCPNEEVANRLVKILHARIREESPCQNVWGALVKRYDIRFIASWFGDGRNLYIFEPGEIDKNSGLRYLRLDDEWRTKSQAFLEEQEHIKAHRWDKV